MYWENWCNRYSNPSNTAHQNASDTPNPASDTHNPVALPEKRKPSEYEWRWVIAFFYQHILLSPPREEWKRNGENGGTISDIMKLLNIKRGSRTVVEKVLDECEAADKKGILANLDRKKGNQDQHKK